MWYLFQLSFVARSLDASTRDQPSWRKTAINNNNTINNNKNQSTTDTSQEDRRSRFRRMRSRNQTEEADNDNIQVLPVAQSTPVYIFLFY